ncbi:alpha/beta hydrolase [Coraliomargarita sp. SDUM461004]|uniref:Alpha/beta hydrolase n=1 Tax=Thalassobacterium sedimentorum TaxID=3041258 RepID=A0ABU1AN65_9BACT|nr:alpha/beta hydrolase [Coraliomargarita sp. SDUM461004]MDQ8196184.1 alpha/beta hydrolase [Coraliomargarita sp. SDUM461004]
MNRYLKVLQCVFFAMLTQAQASNVVGEAMTYKEVDGHILQLHILKPANWKSTDERAALVFYHGGGWVGGGPSAYNEQAEYFAERGMVCVLAEYRLLGKMLRPPDICIEDAKSAFRWVRGHAADLGINPNEIAAVGASAGGHLAATVALISGFDSPQDDLGISCRPDALVLYNPVIDNGPTGYGYKRMKERFREFSPLHNVREGAPPSVVFIGTEDKVVPVETIIEFERKMNDAGVACTAFVFAGLPHSVYHRRYAGERGFSLCLYETDRFFSSLGWIEGDPTVKKVGRSE